MRGVENDSRNGPPVILYLDVNPGQSVKAAKFAGIRRYAEARGWGACAVPSAESRPENLAALLAERKPAGCVVQCRAGASPLLPEAFGSVPVVYLDPAPDFAGGRAAGVVADDRAIARLAMRELRALRPAAFAFVGWHTPQPWSDIREAAFREEAAAAGLPGLVFPRLPQDRTSRGFRAPRLAAWLSALPRRSAVFAADDAVAADVSAACRAAGLSVPRDIAIIGVNDIDGGADDAGASETSTVSVDHERGGYRAAAAVAEGSRGGVAFGPLMVVRRKSTGGRGRQEPFVLKALADIRAEACDGLAPKDLVPRFRCSRWLFEMRFREATGHSVLDEILHVRLERACAMLAGGAASVSAVAGMCGFGSYDAMHDLFRRQFGKTPSQFRALHCG